MPKILVQHHVDDFPPGTILPMGTFAQHERLLRLGAIRVISDEEAAEFTEEEEEEAPAPGGVAAPTAPQESKVKSLSAMNKTEILAFAAEQGIAGLSPDQTRDKLLAQVRASMSAAGFEDAPKSGGSVSAPTPDVPMPPTPTAPQTPDPIE